MSNSDFIIYNQTIVVVYGDDTNSMIQRKEFDYYNFMCKKNRTIIEALEGGGFFNTSLSTTPGEKQDSKCFLSEIKSIDIY